MNTLEVLIKAINNRLPISFEYNKNGEISKRIGNPYVVYIFVSRAGEESTKVDVVQTAGDSDSGIPFPSFRSFRNIEDIINLKILENQSSFGPPFHSDYVPNSDRYKNPIAKI